LAVNRGSHCVFTRGIDSLYLPVAHGEGKFISDPAITADFKVVVQYTDECGDKAAGYPYNPNGSAENIAGICDPSGRVFALMPHPERHVRSTQHPQWTRLGGKNSGDGLKIFQNAVAWARHL
jgi:phosphoribosylformylglycinamidine synthase